MRAAAGSVARRLPWLCLTAYLLACTFWWVRRQWWPEWDSAIYILLGRSLAAGGGYAYLGEPFFLRPPGFPWLLSGVLGDGGLDGLSLNRLVMVFAGLLVAAVYFALRFRHSRALSLGVALLGGTSAMVVARFNRVESDFPFAALLFLGIGLLERARARREDLAWGLAGAISIAAALHVRLVGVLLLPGLFGLALLRRGGASRARSLVPALVAAALAAPWLAYARWAAGLTPDPADQLLAFDYWTMLLRADPGDPGSPWLSIPEGIERVRRNSAGLFRLARATLGIESGWLGGLAVAFALLGFARSLRAPSLLEWFAGAYAALLLLWGAYIRLGLPLVHLFYLYLLLGVGDLAARLWRGRGRPELAGGLVAAGLAALNLASWREAGPPLWPEDLRSAKIEARWGVELEVAELIRAHTPPRAVILADNAPVLSLLTGRRVYTYRFGRRGNLMPRYRPDLIVVDVEEFSAPAFEEELRRSSRRRFKRSEELSRGRLAVYEARIPRRKRPAS